MQLKLYVVPTNHVQQFWYLAEPLLQKALDKGSGEFTAEQLKLLVAQGQQQLLLLMKDDRCICALTVQWIMYPNDRVCYITYIGGKNTKAGFEQFKNWAKGRTKVFSNRRREWSPCPNIQTRLICFKVKTLPS